METRQIVIIGALAFLGFMLYQEWQKDYGALNQPGAQQTADSFGDSLPIATDIGEAPSGENLPVASAMPEVAQQPQTSGKTHTVTTDVVQARTSSRGASITGHKLLQYPVKKNMPNKPVQLLSVDPRYYFVVQGGVQIAGRAKGDNPNHTASWQLASETDNSVVYRWQSGDVTVDKTISFVPGEFNVDVSYNIQNNGTKPLNAQAYGQLRRSGETSIEPPPFVATYMGGAYYEQMEGDKYRFEKLKLKDFADEKLAIDQKGGWIAMIQHHFTAAIIPPTDQNLKITTFEKDDQFIIRYFSTTATAVPAGGSATVTEKLFIGPKLQKNLADTAPGLARTVDYGFTTIISEPLFWVLKKLYALLGNWGWSIIFLTLLVKIVFYKPSEWQYRSMARMRKFAPKIKALKERYADDREKQSQAMMKLYKDEKFNPLGGCLPMLIQMPVFIALYWVLIESVELRQAPFMFWLNDLTSPDPLYILPLIFGVSMFFQQKLMAATSAMDPMQEKVMMFMPIGMTIFFAFFPSGLVLYWVVNNLLGILQQWWITRQVEVEDAARLKAKAK